MIKVVIGLVLLLLVVNASAQTATKNVDASAAAAADTATSQSSAITDATSPTTSETSVINDSEFPSSEGTINTDAGPGKFIEGTTQSFETETQSADFVTIGKDAGAGNPAGGDTFRGGFTTHFDTPQTTDWWKLKGSTSEHEFGDDFRGTTEEFKDLNIKNIGDLPRLCKTPSNNCGFWSGCAEGLLECGARGFPDGYGKPLCDAAGRAAANLSATAQKWIAAVETCRQNAAIASMLDDSDCDEFLKESFSAQINCYLKPSSDANLNLEKIPVNDVIQFANNLRDRVEGSISKVAVMAQIAVALEQANQSVVVVLVEAKNLAPNVSTAALRDVWGSALPKDFGYHFPISVDGSEGKQAGTGEGFSAVATEGTVVTSSRSVDTSSPTSEGTVAVTEGQAVVTSSPTAQTSFVSESLDPNTQAAFTSAAPGTSESTKRAALIVEKQKGNKSVNTNTTATFAFAFTGPNAAANAQAFIAAAPGRGVQVTNAQSCASNCKQTLATAPSYAVSNSGSTTTASTAVTGSGASATGSSNGGVGSSASTASLASVVLLALLALFL